jgi:predicted nucleic acid-binding protein
MSKKFVLDACALIAFLQDEPGAEKTAAALISAREQEATVYMNVVNLLEVYYDIYRSTDKAKADEELVMIKKLPIEIETEISDNIFTEAGRLKASYKISLADSIALAQALATGGELMTADHHEFDAIEGKEAIRFSWIR